MKKTIQSARNEQAEYFCDITKEFIDFEPPVRLKMSFGYGSNLDGSSHSWEFSEKEGHKLFRHIVDYIKTESAKHVKCKIIDGKDEIRAQNIEDEMISFGGNKEKLFV